MGKQWKQCQTIFGGSKITADGDCSHKKNEIMPFAATWIVLEIIVLSEISQRQISYDSPCMWNPK